MKKTCHLVIWITRSTLEGPGLQPGLLGFSLIVDRASFRSAPADLTQHELIKEAVAEIASTSGETYAEALQAMLRFARDRVDGEIHSGRQTVLGQICKLALADHEKRG